MARDEATFRAFAEWWATPRAQRAALGLPDTQKAFAADRGVTPKTLRRWRETGEFRALVEEAEARFRLTPEPEAVDESLDPAERDWREVRRALVQGAKEGDRTSLTEYMKYFGKPFAEAEAAALESSFAELSFDELVEQALGLIGPGPVRAWLEKQEVAA